MNKRLITLICICLLFFGSAAFAQSPVSVNPLTGAGNVVIPLYTVSSGQVSVPISLVYSGSGVKVRDVEGTAGMNWNFQAGSGQISRVVRGLPDDCTEDNFDAARLGWMSASNTAATYASTFPIQNNNNITCSYGTNDIDSINSHIPDTSDTEPDLFFVNAPGLSCELVYNRASATLGFHPVVYQDLVIAYTTVGGTGTYANQIASFTITNDKGIKYVFAQPEITAQTTELEGGTVSYFATKYNQYANGINYYDSWELTGIFDANGNGVVFSYTTAPARFSTDPVILFLGGSTSASAQYYVLQWTTPEVLNTIGTVNANSADTTKYFTFNWTTLPQTSGQTGQTIITSVTGMGRDFTFTYSPVVYTDGALGTTYTRSFLRNFSDPGCSTPINYQFAYIGETYNSGTSTYSTVLPDSASTQVDYWGYYSSNATGSTLIPSVYVLNPVISTYPRYVIAASGSPGGDYEYALLASSNRATTTSTVATGSLNKMTYAQGGNTNIVYASNDYYDPIAGATMEGGGVRVSQIIDSVGNGSTNNIIRNYAYVNPPGVANAGLSSGEPITLPQFAFTIPYSGSATGLALWTNATALSEYDLSNDDHTIMYTYCTESQTGAGSTVYKFNVPSTYWSISNPTVNDVARYSCTATYGPIQNYMYSYPFIPNPNYEFDRGQPVTVVNYNGSGTEVSETDYTYTTSYSPATIAAFKADDGGPSGLIFKGYNRYTVNYNSSLLAATVTKKVYDSNSLSQAQTSEVAYTYGSAYHKLMTQQTTTNSDNSIVNTYIQYIKDFPSASAGTNPYVTAIYNLQLLNINAPVETYQTVTRGTDTVTTGAALTLFAGVTFGSATLYLPSLLYKQVQPAGIPSSPSPFLPFTVNGGTQIDTYDSRYNEVGHFDQYDNTGYPETVDDNFKNVQTSFFDPLSNHATVAFKNAYSSQVAFQDFDSQFAPQANTFTITGSGSFTPVGSHAGNAAGLAGTTQTAATGTITKNTIAQNYIFSIWINAATGGTLTLTVSGLSTNPTISYGTAGWTYYELKIPAASISSSFTVSFISSNNISIDDILLYPDVAEAMTATFDHTAHYKIAQTNTNGVSAYFTNDTWGRMTFAFDQDHNIVRKNTFLTPADVATFSSVSITPLSAAHGFPQTFTIAGPDACAAAGATVSWTFGDGGSTTNSPGLTSPPHTYSTAGNYTVSATVNSPLFGTVTPTPVIVTVY